jgi:Delta7-sterol 5-desaturase
MQSLSFFELLSIQWINNIFRYLFFAGGAFLIFWKWDLFPSLKRIYPAVPKAQMKKEFFYSLRTTVIFLIPTGIIVTLQRLDKTQIYMNLNEHPLWWYAAVFPLMFFIHETYFYWTHRLMHTKKVFRYFHQVHHLSKDPTPFSALSFDVGEALIQSGVFIILSIFLPMHFTHIFFFTIFSLCMGA